MDNYTQLNISKWERRRQFELFNSYDEPFFNITTNVDIGRLPEYCKANGLSFNLATIFVSQKVLNAIPEFKMRIVGDSIRVYETVNCGSTILLPDNTFSFCYYPFTEDLKNFNEKGRADISKLLQSKDFDPRHDELDIIYYSTLPWIKFTSIKHPRKFGNSDSIPKIIFGKWFVENGKYFIPVSVEAHHGLVDGYHMGLYFNGIAEEFNKLSSSIK